MACVSSDLDAFVEPAIPGEARRVVRDTGAKPGQVEAGGAVRSERKWGGHE
jgi:hypothetical protein